jgi:hypothetical protein
MAFLMAGAVALVVIAAAFTVPADAADNGGHTSVSGTTGRTDKALEGA